MTRPTPTVGQIVYSLNVGNAYRQGGQQELTPMVVTKIGTKYFYIKPVDGRSLRTVAFHLDTWWEHTDYSATHKLYESEQVWDDDKDRRRITDLVLRRFDSHITRGGSQIDPLPLATLKKIAALIEGEEV